MRPRRTAAKAISRSMGAARAMPVYILDQAGRGGATLTSEAG